MLEVGKKAPDFELPDQNGEMHKLSDYAGKKVFLYCYPLDKNIKLFFYLNNHLIYALLRSDPAIQNPVLLFLTLTFTIPPLLYFPPVFLFFYYLKSFYDQNRLP